MAKKSEKEANTVVEEVKDAAPEVSNDLDLEKTQTDAPIAPFLLVRPVAKPESLPVEPAAQPEVLTPPPESAEERLERLQFEKTEAERLAAEAAEAHRVELEKAQEELKRLNFERESQLQQQQEKEIAAVQALKVVNDFKCAMHGNLVQFKKGEIVTDRLLIAFLIEQKMPVTLAEESIDFYFCKHCHQKNEI